ncbi:MAG TPA: hypothetical protein VKT19_01485 [Steroidobacteraceae bacterium]|nr:hypothetical protein [Steroidobacteraceae bacterium]
MYPSYRGINCDRETKLFPDYERPTGCARKGESMSKGTERKQEIKKKPAISLMERRAAKAEKRNQKRQWPTT